MEHSEGHCWFTKASLWLGTCHMWRLVVALASVAALCAPLPAEVTLVPRNRDVPPAPNSLSLVGAPRDDAMSLAASVLSEPLPKEPFAGQKRAPCTRHIQVEIIGACWIPHKLRAPCPDGLYEYEGKCYVPVLSARPPPQAGDT